MPTVYTSPYSAVLVYSHYKSFLAPCLSIILAKICNVLIEKPAALKKAAGFEEIYTIVFQIQANSPRGQASSVRSGAVDSGKSSFEAPPVDEVPSCVNSKLSNVVAEQTPVSLGR